MMKAVFVDNYGLMDSTKEKEAFAKEGITFVDVNVQNDEELLAHCKDADAVLVMLYKFPRQIVEQLEKCKVIVRYGIGYDNVDVEACSEKGIAVCNIPDYCFEEVAGHAAALALDCLRQVTLRDRHIRKGEWLFGGAGKYQVRRFSTLTYGLCGFGHIARQTAQYMKGFGFDMIAYDPYLADEVFEQNGVRKVSMEELCKTADIISVHVPLSAETRYLINKDKFAMMKKGVIIVNTSRGPLINQSDLLDAMDAGIVKAAGLDVLETEPLTDLNDRIFQYENVVLTPHFAFHSEESFEELRDKVIASAVTVLRGEIPKNAVNKKALTGK
jgi:D-3-phosphoglycerate dehydrogenase